MRKIYYRFFPEEKWKEGVNSIIRASEVVPKVEGIYYYQIIN